MRSWIGTRCRIHQLNCSVVWGEGMTGQWSLERRDDEIAIHYPTSAIVGLIPDPQSLISSSFAGLLNLYAA